MPHFWQVAIRIMCIISLIGRMRRLVGRRYLWFLSARSLQSAAGRDAEVRAYVGMAGIPTGATRSLESDARMRHDVMLRRALKEMRGGEYSRMHSLRYWLITNNNALLRF